MPKKIQNRLIILLSIILFFYAISVSYLKSKEASFIKKISSELKLNLNNTIINYLTHSQYEIEIVPNKNLVSNELIGTISSGKIFIKDSLVVIKELFSQISLLTGSQIKILSSKEFSNNKTKVDSDKLRVIFEIEQVNSKIKQIIVAEKESIVLKNKLKGQSKEFTELALIFLGLAITLTLGLFFQFINPLSAVIKSFGTNNPEMFQKFKKSKNEFDVLTNLIKDFYDQKKVLEEEVKVRKITQEELETLNDELEKRVLDRTEELALTNLELQKERDQTKQYLDIAGTIIALLDRDGYIQMINKKGDKVLGYNSGELIGKNWRDTCLTEYEKEKYSELFFNIINSNQETLNPVTLDVITKGKEIKTLLFHNTSLNDNDGNCGGILFSAEDITELKQKEKELINAKIKADESNKLKSIFLANMSHELRTPMIGILGYSDLLINELIGEKQKKMAVAIHDSGQRLIDTLNLILDLSRLEANKQSIDYQVVNINALIKNVTFHFEAAAGKKKLFLKTSLPSYDVIGRTDPRMLRDVLNNLINNAIKFTKEGGVFVTLEVLHRDFIISIKDTGIGIPEESLGVIFEEFRQVSEGLGRGFQGTGLGLTICKKYVELLGGQISVKSSPTKGSEFICQIPLFTSASNDDKIPIKKIKQIGTNQTEIESEKTIKDKKILIVEDDITSRDVISLFLKNLYNITFVEDGIKAIEIAKKQNFDLILMDINLGSGITGIEVMESIRKIREYGKTPIIAATAFAMLGDKEKFLSIGFNQYISKPYLKNQLLNVISEALKK